MAYVLSRTVLLVNSVVQSSVLDCTGCSRGVDSRLGVVSGWLKSCVEGLVDAIRHDGCSLSPFLTV